jgi:hypothetical protein
VTAIGASTLTVTFDTTPNAGDIIVPADASSQGTVVSAEFGLAKAGETFWASEDDPSSENGPLFGFYTYS